jgi:hypothetical protein
MGWHLRAGDRIRVKNANRPHGFQVGATGRVVRLIPLFGPGMGVVFVHCEMDGAGPDRLATFHVNEVERAS